MLFAVAALGTGRLGSFIAQIYLFVAWTARQIDIAANTIVTRLSRPAYDCGTERFNSRGRSVDRTTRPSAFVRRIASGLNLPRFKFRCNNILYGLSTAATWPGYLGTAANSRGPPFGGGLVQTGHSCPAGQFHSRHSSIGVRHPQLSFAVVVRLESVRRANTY